MLSNTDPYLLNISLYLQHSRADRFSTNETRVVSAYITSYLFPSDSSNIFQIGRSELYAMARFNQAIFSSLSLTKDDEKKFTEWVTKHTPKPMEAMQELLGQGYKVSITWVTDSNSFCLSLIGTDESRVNKGVIMTSWSDDLEEVILIAAYKHVVVCDGGEWPVRVSGERWG